jgi:hypothetical protein
MNGPLEVLISFGAGAVLVFVLWRITIHDLTKQVAELRRKDEIKQDQINWLLMVQGDVFNHLGWRSRYSSELRDIILLRDRGTPTNNQSIQ